MSSSGKTFSLKSLFGYLEQLDGKLSGLESKLNDVQGRISNVEVGLDNKATITEIATHQNEVKAELDDIRQSIAELIGE